MCRIIAAYQGRTVNGSLALQTQAVHLIGVHERCFFAAAKVAFSVGAICAESQVEIHGAMP